MNLLSILIFLPIVAALLILVLPSGYQQRFKFISLGVSLIQFILSVFIYTRFNSAVAGINREEQFQFIEKLPWIRLDLGGIGKLEIDYFLGIDGLSMPFLMLSALVMFVATLASWEIKTNLKAYFSLFLLLNTAVMGV
ncbi:MAG TPA: NADH-quinone oxidoreductase subunit M, partial [Daejeonella sp.]